MKESPEIPEISEHFKTTEQSAIRLAQKLFNGRIGETLGLNVAIGNVSLPMHPAMKKRADELTAQESPFEKGVIRYTETQGISETQQAFLRILEASECNTDNLHVHVTEGGSHAMELAIVGCLGPAGANEGPLLVIDPTYTNYEAFAKRVGRPLTSVTRKLSEDGTFTLPDFEEVKSTIETQKPKALLLIPCDNPTGQFLNQETIKRFAEICVDHNMWLISDETYRELQYTGEPASSIWKLTEKDVPGITGRRISIESASKVWNACGLRIGALITDRKDFHEKAVAEDTANLCANAMGQYVFGALAHEDPSALQQWFEDQRAYYKTLIFKITKELKEKLPGVIVSRPDAAIYSVVDVRNIAEPGFDAENFIRFCAQEGVVSLNGKNATLLVAPMSGFYTAQTGKENLGKTQMRIAYVLPPEEIELVPELFAKLFRDFESRRT